MNKTANSGQWNTYRIMEGHQFAGTGVKEELFELETNIRSLLATAMIPFREMEKSLMAYGYQPHNIRKAFERVTGLTIEQLEQQNIEALNPPSTVPFTNLGWGEAKGGKYDYYFVMPWLMEYCIFGQSGDTQRDKVISFPDLDEARKWCEKHSKKYHEFNRAINIKDKKPVKHDHNWNEPGLDTYAGLSTDGKSVLEFLTLYSSNKSLGEKESYIKDSYASYDINESDYSILMGILRQAGPDTPDADLKEGPDRVDIDTSNVTKNKDIDDMLSSNTPYPSNPKEFQEADKSLSQPDTAYPIKKAREHVQNLADQVQDRFVISYLGEYTEIKEPVRGLKTNPSVNGTKPMEPFNVKVAVYSKFSVMDNTGIPHNGILAFAFDGEKFYTLDQFKGDNDKKYGFTPEGLDKYLADISAIQG